MDSDAITDFMNGHVPEIVMIAAGFMAILIVMNYRKDKDGTAYRFSAAIGFLLGIAIMVIAVSRFKNWTTFDAVLVLLAGFTLFIRPLTKIDFVVLLALLVMGVVYIYLGTMTGDLAGLSEGYPRIIVAVVAGSFVYMVFHFVEKVIQLIGTLLNCWPILFILGVICLVEGALMLADSESLYTIVERYIE